MEDVSEDSAIGRKCAGSCTERIYCARNLSASVDVIKNYYLGLQCRPKWLTVGLEFNRGGPICLGVLIIFQRPMALFQPRLDIKDRRRISNIDPLPEVEELPNPGICEEISGSFLHFRIASRSS